MNLVILAGAIVAALVSTAVVASWTGISASIEDYSTDWQFQTGQRNTDINQWNLSLEEKTTSAMRIGVRIGQSRIRISDNISPSNTQKFDANSLGLYLRLPLMLGDIFSVYGRLSYRINSGNDLDDINPSEIEWDETQIELGLSGQWQSVRFTPFIAYHNVNGDITDNSGTELFDSVDEISTGIRFDYFLDPTAYVRFQLTSGTREGGYLIFAREY